MKILITLHAIERYVERTGGNISDERIHQETEKIIMNGIKKYHKKQSFSNGNYKIQGKMYAVIYNYSVVTCVNMATFEDTDLCKICARDAKGRDRRVRRVKKSRKKRNTAW